MSVQGKKWQRIYDLLSSSSDRKPLDYTIWGFLEKKTKNKNATSHRNIGSLKTVIKEDRNNMFEEFILKA